MFSGLFVFFSPDLTRDILRDSCDGCSPLSPSSENVDALNSDVKMKASCRWRWCFLWSDCGNKLGPLWMTHTPASYRLFRWSTNTTLYWTVSLISVGYAWHFLTSLGLFCFINGIKKKRWHYCCLINDSSFEGLLPDFCSWVGHVSFILFFSLCLFLYFLYFLLMMMELLEVCCFISCVC